MRIVFAIAATFALATATGSVAVVAANAQTPAPVAAPATPAGRSEAMARLKAADTNTDNKWDKAEWLAAGRREMGFNFIDADKDGFVTADELEAGMKEMRARRAGN